jgi:PIN domain nuclease of toxin-antitoxin system
MGRPKYRLLTAQAMVEVIPISSKNSAFDAYPINRIW